MVDDKNRLVISTTPHFQDKETTPRIMYQVLISLIPIQLAAFYFFGLSALLISLTSVSACLLAEWFFDHSINRGRSLKDGSALITGILLALTLPPGFPLWMTFLGGVVAIGMGKVIWGGLGNNIFNPALLGRAFLQAAFPSAITSWSIPDGRYLLPRGTNFAIPFFQGESVDAISGATPLALMKFQHQSVDYLKLFIGQVSGSLGETCAILIILAGVYLLWCRIISWHIPFSIIITVSLFSGLLYLSNPNVYPSPVFMILSGGLLLGTVFMATDMATSPITPFGKIIFGIGIGLLVILIRIFGGLPEGVMYAILLMNSINPLINRFTQRRIFGT